MELYLVALGVTLASFALFLAAAIRNPFRMRVGFLFCFFLLCAGFCYAITAAWLDNPVLNLSLVLIGVALAFVLFFGLYVLIALLLVNARQMHNRERRTLANRLTLLAGLGLLLFAVLSWAVSFFSPPIWVRALWGGLLAVVTFYFFHIFVFLVSVLLCNLMRPAKRQDYVIVLGARLVEGKPSPLLARRVDAAIRFYHKQAKRRTPPKLIMSGGQGSDEAVTEATAMAQYALEQGIPEQDILLEPEARNTYQNMEYAKKLIEADREKQQANTAVPCRVAFATSNYHLLRSGMLARKLGLKARGLGARTALYYLPTALLREYIAYLKMRLKPLLILAGLLFVGSILLELMPLILSRFIL